MEADADPDEPTAPCDRCELSIPTDVDRCPVCGFHPAGAHPLVLRVGEYALALVVVASVLVFVGGVTRTTPGLPTGAVVELTVATPYTAGVSGFFLYYLREKRRASPTDSGRLL